VVVNNRVLLVARRKSAIQQWLNQWLILTKRYGGGNDGAGLLTLVDFW
jgi:hypothetical protein